MHITVDRSACVGAGQCALVAPEVFDQDDEGLVVLLSQHPQESQWPAAKKAATLCPAQAIRTDA